MCSFLNRLCCLPLTLGFEALEQVGQHEHKDRVSYDTNEGESKEDRSTAKVQAISNLGSNYVKHMDV